jgi:hypothetical protein
VPAAETPLCAGRPIPRSTHHPRMVSPMAGAGK